MKKDINLNSSEWCDVVFDSKNKAYGAYKLRQTSSDRHILAFFFVVALMLIIALLPSLIGTVKELTHKDNFGGTTGTIEIDKIKFETPVEDVIKPEITPPPPPLRSTIEYVPPVIAPDEEVKGDEMPPVETILSTTVDIGTKTVQGDPIFGVEPNEIIENNAITETVVEKPYPVVEQMPMFLGGDAELLKYISSNLKYPIIAQENGIQGRVTLRFVVTATGEIANVEILRGFDPACDKEAVRVVKSMPKWIPGKQNGRNVPVYFTIPVTFRLE